MSCETVVKDPDARLDYVVDWAPWLADSGSDTLATADFAATPNGLTVATVTFTTLDATVWLTGGVAGVLYTVTCHVTTAAGRQNDRSFKLRVRNQ